MPRVKKYYTLDRPAKEMSAGDLLAILGTANNAEIIRTLAINERDFLRVEEPRSLRGFWYSTVKPVLTKLGKLDSVAGEESVTAWDQTLSRHLGDLVKLGVLTYADLKIEDTSRPRESAHDHYSADVETFGYRIAGSKYPGVILCTEKDTAFSILRQVASITGCSCISGSGQNAFSATETLLREIPEGARRNILFLSVTDHDPSGYSIARTFAEQARGLADRLGIDSVSSDRLGILPHQLSREEIDQNKYRPKPGIWLKEYGMTVLDRWVEETGGIDGEPYGLELDAFTPARLRELFVNALRDYIEVDTTNIIREGYCRAQAIEAIRPAVAATLEKVTAALSHRLTVEPHDFWELVGNGWDHLPVDRLCAPDIDEEIRQFAVEQLLSELSN